MHKQKLVCCRQTDTQTNKQTHKQNNKHTNLHVQKQTNFTEKNNINAFTKTHNYNCLNQEQIFLTTFDKKRGTFILRDKFWHN